MNLVTLMNSEPFDPLMTHILTLLLYNAKFLYQYFMIF